MNWIYTWFVAGFFFAWALLILHKIYILVRAWFPKRINEADLVKSEYERLKSAPPIKIAQELKRI